MKLIWPEVTDIKNTRYTNRAYLCPYCTLRVSKSLDLWCVFDRLSNFEKCNLRSGHLMWPGFVTYGVNGSSFFKQLWKCVKLFLGWTAMANLAARSAAKFAIAVQPTIWHISKKTMTRWHQRSRLQVTLSDLTSSCVFRSLTSCQRHTTDPNSLKLAVYSKDIDVYNLYISDFWYRWS